MKGLCTLITKSGSQPLFHAIFPILHMHTTSYTVKLAVCVVLRAGILKFRASRAGPKKVSRHSLDPDLEVPKNL